MDNATEIGKANATYAIDNGSPSDAWTNVIDTLEEYKMMTDANYDAARKAFMTELLAAGIEYDPEA